ncbi:hypothetical protein J2W14_004112 [Pseudarthrobacter oxydans]|uniref:hypothetical protein n=1 Tax=Pseudarthrobacter oxydans TaxID=1671 RepID=UPI0027879F41|nr:hypothetical protein [Pseudarthrobacter oxydans]MDP9984685.1 hypothetical protein [Pseudarthrobacter oxydans]
MLQAIGKSKVNWPSAVVYLVQTADAVRLGVGVDDAGRLGVELELDSAGAVVVEVGGGAAGWPQPASSKATRNAAETATPDVADLLMSPSKDR